MTPGNAQAVGDVVVDRFRKWIRFLEDHADAPPEIDHVQAGSVDVDAFNPDRAARNLRDIDEIVHPVQTTQERRLAAARRSDEGGDRSRRNAQVDVVQDLVRAVVEIEMLDLDHAALALAASGIGAGWLTTDCEVDFRHFGDAYHDRRLLASFAQDN